MPIGLESYPLSILPDSHWRSLYDANVILIDNIIDDLGALADGESFADLMIANYLPRRYLLRYDEGFLRKFLVCLVAVGLKLRLHDFHPLGCTAEELALFAMKQLAGDLLEEQGIEPEFGDWDDMALEDTDHEYLYDPALDGIEDLPQTQHMAISGLKYDEWFTPFEPPRVAHPYVNDQEVIEQNRQAFEDSAT